MSHFEFPEAVVIRSKHHRTVAGLQPAFRWGNTTDGTAMFFSWFEGRRDRLVRVGAVLQDSAESLRFSTLTDPPDMFEVVPMTLQLYNKEVRPRTAGKARYGSMRELLEAMRREW